MIVPVRISEIMQVESSGKVHWRTIGVYSRSHVVAVNLVIASGEI